MSYAPLLRIGSNHFLPFSQPTDTQNELNKKLQLTKRCKKRKVQSTEETSQVVT